MAGPRSHPRSSFIRVNQALHPRPWLHVVLVEPSIAPNVGNIARTCAGARLRLHLIPPLGFALDDRRLKRAGLDYWPRVELFLHETFPACLQAVRPHCVWLITRKGRRIYTHADFHLEDMLVFGNESHGLPDAWLKQHAGRTLRIPQTEDVRSYNLATAVGVVALEALRQVTGDFRRPLETPP